ncbi:lipase family protein [Nocardia takedensis]|uniref:lipase family protein n=1 Tax=Nocardia takedensis TaxID=259390 RepID=UPI0012F70046|nr:lipase family protein [Nocardia takedensis]
MDLSETQKFYRGEELDVVPRPGRILRRRSVTLPWLGAEHRAWQLVYTSRTAHRAPIASSGIVIAPEARPPVVPAPILAYCPAFHGLGGDGVPSQIVTRSHRPTFRPSLELALWRGWTVVVPDGQGLGLTGLGPHAWLAGRAAAHATLDLVRAVQRMPDLEAAEAPCVVWGYADGGRAAVWSAEVQPAYAPELDLRGIAAGAVVADPGALVVELDGGPLAGLVLAGLVGLGRAYAHLPVFHLLSDQGRSAIEQGKTMSRSQLRRAFATTGLGQWCERPDPWNDPVWRYVLAHEIAGRATPYAKVHLYHGVEDTVVPVAMGRQLVTDYRARGADLSWREYSGGHSRAAAAGASDAVERLAAHLREPRPSPRVFSAD